ncbi:hypothetical protein [Thermogymnomonas acidicola]|uniref:TIM-barrel domain-containing protein n=1 Tax=Thermogymnomonas acidicola TaxID=399579 RepID=UPI00094624A8|nr:TIM-barrel domain-containing protein [Thermogymnomonas acidicola]
MNYDLRGSLLKMWNHDANGSYGSFEDPPLYISIPVYIVEGEVTYLVFHNNPPSQGEIDMDFNHQGMIRARFSGCGHDMFIFPGSLKEVLRCLRDISGPQSLPPRWALGFHQSRYSYMNGGDEVMSVARGFKDNGLPISAIHLDIDYMDGYRVFTVDRNRFVDLAGMNRDLASMGIRTVAIIDPGVKVDDNYSVYREGLRRDAYVKWPDGTYVNSPVWPGNVAFPDFTEEKVRDWWGGSNYESSRKTEYRGGYGTT